MSLARSYDQRGVPQRGLLVSVGIKDLHGLAWTNDHEVEAGLSYKMNRVHYCTLVEERDRHRLSRHLVGLEHVANRATGEELTLNESPEVIRRNQRCRLRSRESWRGDEHLDGWLLEGDRRHLRVRRGD